MSRLLLLLSLIGAAIYALLIYTHRCPNGREGRKDLRRAASAQSSSRAPEFVGLLPSGPVHKPKSAISLLSTIHSFLSKVMRLAKTRSAAQTKLLPQRIKRHPLKAARSQSRLSSPKPVELAKVILAAQTHSQASVSSPTVRFYRPGTELQVVRREGIWFEVSDPVTQERGWVLAQYLSSIESPTPTQVATESTTEPPTSHLTKIKQAAPIARTRGARRGGRKCRSVECPMESPRRPPPWIRTVYVPSCPEIRTAMRQHNLCN